MIVADEGKIHKIVQWTRNGDSQSALLDIFDVTPGEPIQVHATNKLRFNTRFSRVDVIKIAAEISNTDDENIFKCRSGKHSIFSLQ